MPGEQPPTLPRDLQPCQIARSLGCPSQHPLKDHSSASRTTQGMRDDGSKAQGSPEARLSQAKDVEQEDLSLRGQAPAARSRAHVCPWPASRMESSHPQLHSLSPSRIRCILGELPKDLHHEAPQVADTKVPQTQKTRARHRTCIPRAEALPSPEENSSQRCFQEAPSSFTSTNCTSPSATPGPLPRRAPQSNGTSPRRRHASGTNLQAIGTNPWPPAAENSFPGANYGVPSAEPKPFPEGSRPSSPQGVSAPYPFPVETVQHERAAGTMLFTFHQPLVAWSEEALGTNPAYPSLSCNPGPSGGASAPSDLGGALSPPGAPRLLPSPFQDSLHKSLTKGLPEGPPPAHDGLGSPRGLSNPPPQRHFPGQGYGANGVGTSPASLDTELPTSGPPPTHLSQLWDTTAAPPYPTSTLGPAAAAGTAFFKSQQQLCLPHSPPLPWSPVLTTPGPNPHQMGVLSRLTFPRGSSEWQGDSPGTLGALNTIPRPGESALRSSPGQLSNSPRLLAYGGLKDPGTQPLFFGGAQPQMSPQGALSLPPPRAVGASPSESPLPSPATHTASSSTCSSLSPPSSSPANPSSEDSQQPGPLRSPAFFLPPTHSQETSSPFPSPEPTYTLSTRYHSETAKAFPLPTEGPGAEDTFKSQEGASFSHKSPSLGRDSLKGFPPEPLPPPPPPPPPPPYSAQHFSLSSASLDQLDVLLTCRQCDRNYSSLTAFLEHRPLCSLLLTKTKDGSLQPPGLPTPTTTSKAPTDAHSALLEHNQAVPFLLTRDDPAVTPFPLPTSDLDMEDDAKLDRLITEALNGMEYQSDNPEIDSSFIDVFADEEPSGSRGASTGHPLNTQVGATPKNGTQPQLPSKAAVPEPQAPRTGDRSHPARNRPKTRSLGLASAEADVTTLIRQQRRGKQFKLFRKEPRVAKGANSQAKAICLRPRKKGHSAERPRPQARKSQTRKGHPREDHSLSRATSKETRSSKHLQLPSGKDSRKRRGRGGSWSKELIHKIVRQKNRHHRQQVPRNQVSHVPLLPGRPPCTQERRSTGQGCASESEEEAGTQQRRDLGGPARGCSPHSRQRWRQGKKRKKEDLTQNPRKVMRQEAGENGGSPTPRARSLLPSSDAEEVSVERGLEHRGHPIIAPKHPPRVLATTKTQEGNHAALDFPQEGKKPEVAAVLHPYTTELRAKPSSPADCGRESPRPAAPVPAQAGSPQPSRSHPETLSGNSMLAPDASCLLGTSGCMKPPTLHTREDSASQPGRYLVPIDKVADMFYTESSLPVFKDSSPGCDPDHCDRHSIECPAAKRGPLPNSDTSCELFLGSKDLANCFPDDLYAKPLAMDPLPARSCYLSQDSMGTLESTPPKSPPYPVGTDPGKVHSPLTLESTSLFAGLPEDGFDPPLYDSLSANRVTLGPLAGPDPLPKKPLADPLYPPFLLLEEVSPMLPGSFPGLSKGKTFSKQCPLEKTVPPRPPAVPEKGRECSLPLMSNLCEDELEIKRLVTELESQLQGEGNTLGTLGEPEEATREGMMDTSPKQASLLPTNQATSPQREPAEDITGLEGSSTQWEGARKDPQKQWPYPASCHTEKAAPPPGIQDNPGSRAPLSPEEFTLSFQRTPETIIPGADSQIPLSDRLPDSSNQQAALLHSGSLAKDSPKHGLLFPKYNEAPGTQNENAPPLLPGKHTRGHSLDPSCEAQEPCPTPPAQEGLNSPNAHLTLEPNLILKGDEEVTSLPSASLSHGSKGHPEGGFIGAMLNKPVAKDLGFKGAPTLTGTSPQSTLQSGGRAWSHPVLDPPWEPSASIGQSLQEPACSSFPLRQVLDATAKSGESTQGLQPGDPSVTGGASTKEGSSGAINMSVLPANIQKQLRSKADGRLGSPGQPEKIKGQCQANRLRPKSRRSLGDPDTLTKVNAHSEARPARGRRPRQGNRAARGLRRQALSSTSSTDPDSTSLVPIQKACPLQKEPAERSPEKAASPQPLFSQENPAPSDRGLTACVLSTMPQATPTPSDLEPIPQEDPGTRVKPNKPPAPSSHRDLPSPDDQPTCPVLAPLGASHGPATKDAEPSAAPTLLVTSCCGPEEPLSQHSLLGTSSPKDPPVGSLGSISFSAPGLLERTSPNGITVRTLEDSGKEELRLSPAHSSALPLGDPSSPKMTIEAAPLTSIAPKDGLDSGETLEVPAPHCMEAPSLSNPERMDSKDPSLGPQSSNPCPGQGDSHSIIAVPTDLATLETTEPDSQICQEDEAEVSIEEQDSPETPGTRHCDVTKVARASARGMPTGLHLALETPLIGTSSNSSSDPPQYHISISHHPPQKDSSDPQDHKRRPCGLNKKPEHAEQTPTELPETCQLCSASFRSKAGLSRHKARKHRPQRESRSLLTPMLMPACQPLDPMPKACQTPGKKSRKTPGKGRPSRPALGAGRSSGPPPLQDTVGPEILKTTSEKSEGAGTPDTPLSQHPPTPGLIEQGKSAEGPASKPRRADRCGADRLHPDQTEVRGQRQGGEPTDPPSHPERKPNRKGGKLRGKKQKHGPGGATHVTSDPSTACGHPLIPLSLSPEGGCRPTVRPPPPSSTGGPRTLEDAEDIGPGALCTVPARKAPQERRVCQGTIEKEHPVEQKATWTQWFWGPEEARASDISGEPSRAIKSQPAEDHTGVKGKSDGGTGKGTPDLPDRAHSLEVDSTISSYPQGPIEDLETQNGVHGLRGATPDAPSPEQKEPPDLFDDEISFSRLFPLDGRLTQKNLRVYGKRCKRPKCPSPKEPIAEVINSVSPGSTRLPTDLSDSGSLCLSREEEDVWDDEVMSLPESLLLDGLLSNKTPGLDPWTPSLSLWALDRQTCCLEEKPSCFVENQDEWSEPIPQLHMVPAAWRDLDPCSPAWETASSVGDMSPEPPNLEREHDNRPPRSASLPPLYVKDFEVLSTQLEIQDLCFLGPCSDLADLPNPGALDFQAIANSQGPPNKRMEGTARARRAKGRDLRVKGRRASYKCRVCFQRFHNLGELDLHKLSHSPSPPPTCYLCVERRFSSRELLREHLWEKHVQGKAGPWACGMCLKEVADVWMYNQHLREHAARFARNGQARRALGDLPGCLEGESTLTHFLNTIVERASKPQRTKRSIGKASGEPSEQEGEAGKKTPRRMKRKARASVTPSQDGAEGGSPSVLSSSSDSAKTPPTPSPDPWSHGESPLQAVPVHEDCKDPSRDCHHCGKQFPKPFKLQRHLAVHSPQRVYLCPRCPQVYPEPWELKVHLGLTHGVTEEKELPHVPLYACELCANVMHVIRRSFVCSSCNYTFAKKEQFDRHMGKHLSCGLQPFTLRSVKRPGVPRRKTRVSRDVLPSKRHRLMAPSSPCELSTNRVPSITSPTPSEVSLPARPLICSETAPSLTLDQPSSQESPVDQADHSPRGNNPPLSGQDLPPPSLSPFSAASAEGAGGGCKLNRSLEKPEHEASSLGSLEPCKWQTLVGGKRALHLFPEKHKRPGNQGKCAPGCSPGDPSQLQERLVTTHHMAPEGRIEGPSQKGNATKPGACSSTSHHRAAEPTKKPLKPPGPPRKPGGMGIPAGELVSSPEDRVKPNTSKGKLRPSSQSSGGLQPGAQTGGGSQPQPTSGQLQSEMASTPTEPSCPSWVSSTPYQPSPRAHTKGSTREPGDAVHQGVQVRSSPREKRESHGKQRKGQALGLGRHGSVGNTGKAPSAPDKSSRPPRKQATPSRVPPVKSRPSGQSSRARPQPSAQPKGDPGHTSEKGSLTQARAPSRSYKRVRTPLHSGVEPMEPRDLRTAEAQSDLLSQLFGQKLTSFKIPLKKDSSQ
ncbi:zinc finger protein 469 [Mus pahari]|uniref:zinc finger protein 469 n=1 Tax=Mus pahari TaxID=10093 RepID=UPI000A30DB88|nr:zinc finger protein 469 [Mus pahari]